MCEQCYCYELEALLHLAEVLLGYGLAFFALYGLYRLLKSSLAN